MSPAYHVVRTSKAYYTIEANSEQEAIEKSDNAMPYHEEEQDPKTTMVVKFKSGDKKE